MTSHPSLPPGHRLVEPDEVVARGDMFWGDWLDQWVTAASTVGLTPNKRWSGQYGPGQQWCTTRPALVTVAEPEREWLNPWD